jgi:NADH dehydrogenase FAD-containing subunit
VIEQELARHSVELRFNTEIEDAAGATIWMSENGVRRGEEFDAVVWTGRVGMAASDGTDKAGQPNMIAIGECSGARGLYETTLGAYRAACAL